MRKLADLCDFQRGLTYSKKDEVDFSSNVVLRASNINLKTNTIDLSELKYVKDTFKIPFDKKVKKGSIIICTASGSKIHLGKVALVDDDYDYAFGGFMGQIMPRNEIESKYLFYSLTSDSYRTFIDELSSGVNINNLRFDDLKDFEIPLPPIDEQKRIVKILDEVFDSVAKAKETTEKNLKNAREVFESYLQSIDAKKESLGKIVNITTGKLDANAAVEGGKYPFFTCSKQIFAIDDFAFDCEAILLAGNNAVGDFNVKHYIGKFNAYQRTYIITLKNENEALYKYLYFQLLNSLKEFKAKSVGAGTKFLKLGMIKDLQIPFPSFSEQKQIVAKLDALSAETKKLEEIYKQKLTHLEEIKKSILKKAFNGEL